jgi:hypothetical protein
MGLILDYELDMPKYRQMGLQPSKCAPPAATQIASQKFWLTLESSLATENHGGPRKRTAGEKRLVAL